jgi:hypothetical protein
LHPTGNKRVLRVDLVTKKLERIEWEEISFYLILNSKEFSLPSIPSSSLVIERSRSKARVPRPRAGKGCQQVRSRKGSCPTYKVGLRRGKHMGQESCRKQVSSNLLVKLFSVIS